MINLKTIVDKIISREVLNHSSEEQKVEEFRKSLGQVNFHFREGFAERVLAKKQNLQTITPYENYLSNLSGLMPKILGISLATLIVLGLILLSLYGSLNPDNLLGIEKIDDSNFISYLIYHK